MNAILLTAALAAGVGLQDHQPQTTGTGQKHLDRAAMEQNFRVHRASEVVGMKVHNPEGEDLGEIEDVVLAPDGRIAYAVLSFGGFLDIGDKLFALPWGCLGVDHQLASDEDAKLVIDVPKERLKNAPGFEGGKWPEAANTAWCTEVDTYFSKDEHINAHAVPASTRPAAYVIRCTKLKGKKVENLADEKLGDVKDLVLDPINGRVAYAILSVGGFLGMGDHLVAVPWEALNLRRDGDETKVRLDITKERLEQAPQFKDGEGEWKRMCDPVWIREDVYGFYGVEPYWSDDEAALTGQRVGDLRRDQ